MLFLSQYQKTQEKLVSQCPLLKKEKVIGDVITKTSKQYNKLKIVPTTFRERSSGCCKKLGRAPKLGDVTHPFFGDTYKLVLVVTVTAMLIQLK